MGGRRDDLQRPPGSSRYVKLSTRCKGGRKAVQEKLHISERESQKWKVLGEEEIRRSLLQETRLFGRRTVLE